MLASVYKCTNIRVSFHTCNCVYEHKCMHVDACEFDSKRTCACVCVCLHKFMHVHVSECYLIYAHTWRMSMYMRISICMHICVTVHVQVVYSVCVQVCVIYMYACCCSCVYVHTHNESIHEWMRTLSEFVYKTQLWFYMQVKWARLQNCMYINQTLDYIHVYV
jgi:hypothetical protein